MTESRVIITADANRGVQEFQRFRAQAVGALEHVSQAGGVIGKVLGAVGASLSVAAFTGWIKGAIDATDAASDLSQKTGIAIGDLAGMELAFKKGGMEAGALEATMSKLSKQIVDGNDAFDKLGVKTKDANGQLKGNKDVLYELADKFADMEDGVQKTALAQEIFGKSGAAMIPMLNEGSEGLRAMDDMARKLGLTLSEETVEQAGNFNDTLDLLVLGGQGVARGIAAELLPTLSSLTGQFLTTMTSGDKLKNTAAFLAAGLRILYTVGIGIVEVFSTVGKTVGAAGAQLVALLQGNFSQAAEIGRMWQKDIGDSWAATVKSIEDAWADSGNASVDSMVNFTRHSTVVGKSAAELADQSKKAAKAHQEEAKALAELAGLTGTFADEWKQLSGLYAKGAINLEQLTKAQADLLAKQPAMKAAAEQEIADRKILLESAEQYTKAYDLAAAAKAKALAGLQAQKDENEEISLGALELAELNAKRLESQALRADENAEIAEGLDLTGALAQQYRDEAAALRELAGAQREGVRKKIAADEAKSAEESWKRGAENIEKSLTDALLRGFESGQSIGENLVNTLKNMFNTLILRPIVQAVVQPVANQISGIMQGGTSGAGGGLMSLFSTGQSIFSGFSSGFASSMGSLVTQFGNMFGSTAMSSFGQGMGMSQYAAARMGGGAYSAGSSAAGAVSVAGWIAAGMALADGLFKRGFDPNNSSTNTALTNPLIPGAMHNNKIFQALGMNEKWANMFSGASVVTALFGRKNPEIESQGIRGSFGGTGFSGEAYANIIEKGGLFRSNKRYEKTAPLSSEQDTAFDQTFKGLLDAAKGFASTLGIEASVIGGYNKSIKLELGKDEAKNKEAIAKLFGEMGDELTTRLVPSIASFTQAGETASATLQRLVADYATIDQALNSIGMQFGSAGVASLAARERLVQESGGLDAFAANTAGFQQNFLSQAERNAPVLKAVTEQLAAMGFAGIDTRDEFKHVVQGLDLTTEAGAKQYGALLKLQAGFAQVFPAIEDTAAALAQTNKGYQDQIDEILRSRMSAAELRDLDIRGMDASTVALYDRLVALRAETAALNAQAEAERLSIQVAKDRATTLLSDVDAAFSVLQKVVAREKAVLQEEIALRSESVNRLRGMSNALHSTLDNMRSAEDAMTDRASAQTTLRNALAVARAGGAVQLDQIQKALGVVASTGADQYETQQDYLRDLYTTRNVIQELTGLTDNSLTVEERTLKSLNDQVKQYDRMLAHEEEQINVQRGILTNTLSIEKAILALRQASNAAGSNPLNAGKSAIETAYYEALGRAPDSGGLQFYEGQLANGVSQQVIVDAIKNSPEAKLKAMYQETLGRTADASGLQFYMDQVSKGVSLETIKAAMAQSDEAKAKAAGIPAFANGGDHAGGVRLVGELGPELEVTGPSRIHSTNDLMASLRSPSDSSAVLAAAVDRLTAENAQMRRELNDALYAIAKNTLNTADALDEAMNGEKPLATKAVTEQ